MVNDDDDWDRILKPTREYPTNPLVFEALAQDVLGRDWIARLARAVGVNIRTAQRWASAGRIISPQAWEWLYAQQAALERSGFKGRLAQAKDHAEHAGVSPNTMVALLRDEADHIVEGQRMAAGKGPFPPREDDTF